MALLIDKGEKKLLRRETLDENGAQVSYSDMNEYVFEFIKEGRVRHTFTKSDGEVLSHTNGVKVELLESFTSELVSGTYDLKSTVTVDDSRFPSGSLTDSQTEQDFCIVLDPGETATGDSSMIEDKTITFDIVAPDDPVVPAPSEAPTISFNSATSTTITMDITSVPNATSYEYDVNNSGTYVDVGDVSQFTISSRTQNERLSVKARAVNDTGEGPDSVSKTVYTLPNESPTFTIDSYGSTSVTYTLAGITGQTNTISYYSTIDGGSTYTLDVIGSNTITGLTAGQSYTLQGEARNPAGTGPLGGDTAFTIVEEPVWDENNFTNTATTVTVVWTEGGPNYEIRVDGGTAFSATGTSDTITGLVPDTEYTIEIRTVDNGQQTDWVSILVQTDASTLDETSQTYSFTTA